MRRYRVNKGSSARKFKADIRKTKVPNLNRSVMRGGWRL